MKIGDTCRTTRPLRVETRNQRCCACAHDDWELWAKPGTIVIVVSRPMWGECMVETVSGARAYTGTSALKPIHPLEALGGMSE
jgi:hypothetical protein